MGFSGKTFVDHGDDFDESLLSRGFARNHGSKRLKLNGSWPSILDFPGESSGVVSGPHGDGAVSSGGCELSISNFVSPGPEFVIQSQDSLEDERLDDELRRKARSDFSSIGSGESFTLPFVLVGDTLNVGEVRGNSAGGSGGWNAVQSEVPFQDWIGSSRSRKSSVSGLSN